MPNTVPESQSLKAVHVAVALIERTNLLGQREILIAKRPDDVHQGGLWEFPGGKVEPGEALAQALDRELHEELGIRIPLNEVSQQAFSPLIQIEHDYGDKRVLLDVLRVRQFTGEPEGKEGQAICWVKPEKLADYDFPAANQPIIMACNLPACYAITPEYDSLASSIQGVGELLANHSMLLFRQPQLELREYQYWSEQLLARYQSLTAKILLSGNPSELAALNSSGIHMPFRIAKELQRRPISNSLLFGVSCHNESEIVQAQRINADFITLSPVLPTQSHPDAVSLGWARFSRLARAATMPVYALGGMTREHQTEAVNSGAQGIAGIRLWQQYSHHETQR